MRWLAAKFRALFLVIFRPTKPDAEPPTVTAVKSSEPRRRDGVFGCLYYLDDLLAALDGYFQSLKWLRANDPETYDLYSQIGGHVITKNTDVFQFSELTPRWRSGETRPAFGMIHFGVDYRDEEAKRRSIVPRLTYFRRIKGRSNVQPTNFDLYELVLFYVDTENPRVRLPAVAYLSVDPSGNVSVLKQRVPVRHALPPSKSRHTKHNKSFVAQEWRLPHAMTELAKYRSENGASVSAEDVAAQLFRMATTGCEYASAGAQVRVTRGGIAAVFHIDVKRTPYFFKDRKKTATVNGTSKRIFHIVRPHKRGDSVVRFHFRGERKFEWNDYSVLITMPGYHHRDILEMDVTAFDEDDVEIAAQETTDAKEMGKIIVDHMSSPAPWFERGRTDGSRHVNGKATS